MNQLTVYMLDRNAVDLIKESNAGKSQKDKKKIDFIGKLKLLDLPSSHFSPLLSIIEGEHGIQDSAQQKSQCQKKESESLRHFFKNAVVDSEFLDQFSSALGEIFTEFREEGWSKRERFAVAAVPLIVEGVRKERRRKVEKELIELAKNCELSPSEPVIIMMLACLYGSWGAREVIKPTDFKVYNFLSDLQILSRLNLIIAIGNQFDNRLRFEFLSRDEGLNEVFENIRVVKREATKTGINLQLQYLKGLFPALSEDEHIDLLSRLEIAD